MSNKRKCVVSESLLKEFEFMKQGVNEHSAFCSCVKLRLLLLVVGELQ
jgi:hypothetical protein